MFHKLLCQKNHQETVCKYGGVDMSKKKTDKDIKRLLDFEFGSYQFITSQ